MKINSSPIFGLEQILRKLIMRMNIKLDYENNQVECTPRQSDHRRSQGHLGYATALILSYFIQNR